MSIGKMTATGTINNPFDQLLEDSQHDPRKLQQHYQAQRSNRNAQNKATILDPGFPGWQADEILRTLYAQETSPSSTNKEPFVDTRHGIIVGARPPQHIRELVAEVQQSIQEAASTLWFTPPDNLHVTVLDVASKRPETEVDGLFSHLQQSGIIPDLVDYTFDHRARLVKPAVNYDATAIALTFVPAAGEKTDANRSLQDDGYTYHHLRRDLYGQVSATGLEMKPRYIVPSAHITIARFMTQEGFRSGGAGADGDAVDRERVAALVERFEEINKKLQERHWPSEDGSSPSKGEWLVGQEKGLELIKGTPFYGGGEQVLVGRGF